MCGIGAIIRSEPAPWTGADRARVGRAMQRLSRRGPDSGAAHWTADGRHVLLHRRLAIQDLSDRAAQPMQSPDGRWTLVYNGEIYNAAPLRDELRGRGWTFHTRSDTEVLLAALATFGVLRTLERVRGMFAFAALHEHDGRTRVFAAVDPAGMKPLAWRMEPVGAAGPTLTLASDGDALRDLCADDLDLDPAAFVDLLSIGYIPAPGTIWRGVNKLGPGCAMEWVVGDPAGPRVWTYWRPPVGLSESDEDAHERMAELIGDIAQQHLIGDVPIGLFLSAGLDSSSIALALHERRVEMESITAYTLSAEDDVHDESPGAADLARRLGMRHRTIRLAREDLEPTIHHAAAALDEPQGFTAVLTMTRIARAVRAAEPGLKVVLSGDGADEALGGYAWHRDASSHPLNLGAFKPPSSSDLAEHATLAAAVATPDVDARTRMAALHALGRLSYAARHRVRTFGGFHPAEARALLAGIGDIDECAFAADLTALDAAALPHPRRAQRLDLYALCHGSILPKVDRACMSVGLEVRSPFLDRRVLDAGLSLPLLECERTREGSKPALRLIAARAIEAGLAPPELLSRSKQGFSLRPTAGEDRTLTNIVRESSLASEGLVRGDWAAFLTTDAQMRRVRLFTLAMLAAWWDARRRRDRVAQTECQPAFAAAGRTAVSM